MLPILLHFYKPESLAFGKRIGLMVLKNINEMQINQAAISYIYFRKSGNQCIAQKLPVAKVVFKQV